jgi:hypothetical protein
MARATAFVGGLLCGVLLGTAVLVSHADPAEADVKAAAEQVGVQPADLLGAMLSTGQSNPFAYLRSVGELPPLQVLSKPPPVPPVVSSSRVACIIGVESKGDPTARNRSGASGLGQFLPGTWASTPQGRAGLSVFNPAANRAAIQYMLDAGRAREFDAVRFYGC